jgi:hypothetical protein
MFTDGGVGAPATDKPDNRASQALGHRAQLCLNLHFRPATAPKPAIGIVVVSSLRKAPMASHQSRHCFLVSFFSVAGACVALHTANTQRLQASRRPLQESFSLGALGRRRTSAAARLESTGLDGGIFDIRNRDVASDVDCQVRRSHASHPLTQRSLPLVEMGVAIESRRSRPTAVKQEQPSLLTTVYGAYDVDFCPS